MTHYLIYKITNKLNGKIYIGKHQTDNLDDGYMGSGIAIQRAIKKYGIENFTKEILFDVYGPDLMDFLEEAIVDEAFVAREDTYNIAPGGCGGALFKGHHHSNETKKKMSKIHRGQLAWNKGKHHTEESKLKMSKSRKGKPKSDEHRRNIAKAKMGELNPFYGKHHSEETKRKISEANKGRPGPNKGKIPWNKGKTGIYSEETRRKMSEARKRREERKKEVA